MKTTRFTSTFSKLLVTLAVIVALFSGCGSPDASKESKTDSSPAQSMDAVQENSTASGLKQEAAETTNSKTPTTNRKLIKNAELFIETTSFDESIKKLEASITKFDGYIESNNITGISVNELDKEPRRSAAYTIRIPANSLDAYLNSVGNIGNVLSKTISTDDVTDQYFDTEARLASLKVQEQRLLELLKQTGSLKDVIEIEKELSSVRYEIESLTTTLKKYDSLVNYSTVHLTLAEVATITDTTQPKTIGERIAHTFKNNITAITDGAKNITVFLIGNSPVLLLLTGIIAVGVFIIRKLMKRDKNNNISS